MKTFNLLVMAFVAILLATFQNCGNLNPPKEASSADISSVAPNPSPNPLPLPAPAGDPTSSIILEPRIVPGEKAVLNIMLNASPAADLVYTYSTQNDSAVGGTHFTAVSNASGGIFAGSSTAQIQIDTSNAAGVAYFGKSFKVAVNFPSKPALSKVVTVTFSAAPAGSPFSNKWAAFPVTAAAPSARWHHSAVWTGSRMIVFGGFSYVGSTTGNSVIQNNGKSYDPATDSWIDINVTGGPGARANHSAVWTGSKMIIFGGRDVSGNPLNTGMSYDPATNLWSPISSTGAPSARYAHVGVWTGSKMIVWGGTNITTVFNDGAIYDPATNTWAPLTAAAPPSARAWAAGVWTGSKMIVAGGSNSYTAASGFLVDGKAFDPIANTWTDISAGGAPSVRTITAAVWTGSKMVVHGGYYNDGVNQTTYNTGAIYDPTANTWSALNTAGGPAGRYGHTAVWTGSSALFWGGASSTTTTVIFGDGGIYY